MSKNEEKKEMSLEETFEEIDSIMEKLQDEDISLEDSFVLYKSGMEMLGHCREVIDEVEKKVKLLSENDEDIQEDE